MKKLSEFDEFSLSALNIDDALYKALETETEVQINGNELGLIFQWIASNFKGDKTDLLINGIPSFLGMKLILNK
jgi:hypothetical protein